VARTFGASHEPTYVEMNGRLGIAEFLRLTAEDPRSIEARADARVARVREALAQK